MFVTGTQHVESDDVTVCNWSEKLCGSACVARGGVCEKRHEQYTWA